MMSVLNMTNAVLRSSLYSVNTVRSISTCNPLYFRATEILMGEPLKKKKKMDPAVIRAREERKKRKMEKRIRYLEKRSHYMKPIDEIDGLFDRLKDETRSNHLTSALPFEEIERRRRLHLEWTRYKQVEWMKDIQAIKSVMMSQETALRELKAASIELYKKAVEIDDSYLPYNATGPVDTPPIKDYESPDGEYIETTVKYPGEIE
ncbi:39S ribosomal protein L40, mitochondrial [Ceratina calcarata]|uniref:Large ribosomal subunit protein mL40 n=1 Tax=Ceratina calcarata TaxID=156304 RepID=A0AAJ7IYE5_9HYME|nr:39S ribosomal protein L40, mitochondrial [Ceratina calcarata]